MFLIFQALGSHIPVFQRCGFIPAAKQADKRAGTFKTHHVDDLVHGVFGSGEQQLGPLQPQLDQELVRRLVINQFEGAQQMIDRQAGIMSQILEVNILVVVGIKKLLGEVKPA
jgi:hypothetical protein